MNKTQLIYVIKAVMIYNALYHGWQVNIINDKSIEMYKRNSEDVDLDSVMNDLLIVPKIDN